MIPSKDEMISVLENGDDSKRNVLIINNKGQFELRKFSEELRTDDSVAVRFESFSPNSHWVGPNICDEINFIKHTYNNMLDGWLIHLETGNIGVIANVDLILSENEANNLIQKIKTL